MKILTNICSDDLVKSKTFYVELFSLQIQYESDWYVQLSVPGEGGNEYGIIRRDHELVPEAYQNPPNGMYVTFVVADVDAVYQQAVDMAAPIVQEPRNEFYGQRRFLVKDPNGCLIDVCSPWTQD